MVWPILISVGVMPRMVWAVSGVIERATASAAHAATGGSRRIFSSPLPALFAAVQRQHDRFGRNCHVRRHDQLVADAQTTPPSSPRNGYAVVARGARRSSRRASKDGPQAPVAILREARKRAPQDDGWMCGSKRQVFFSRATKNAA